MNECSWILEHFKAAQFKVVDKSFPKELFSKKFCLAVKRLVISSQSVFPHNLSWVSDCNEMIMNLVLRLGLNLRFVSIKRDNLSMRFSMKSQRKPKKTFLFIKNPFHSIVYS